MQRAVLPGAALQRQAAASKHPALPSQAEAGLLAFRQAPLLGWCGSEDVLVEG